MLSVLSALEEATPAARSSDLPRSLSNPVSVQRIAIHKTFVGEKADGSDMFKVKGKFASECDSPDKFSRSTLRLIASIASNRVSAAVAVGGAKMVVEFVNFDQTSVSLTLKGSILDRTALVTLGDRPVAQITRQLLNGREFFADKQVSLCSCHCDHRRRGAQRRQCDSTDT